MVKHFIKKIFVISISLLFIVFSFNACHQDVVVPDIDDGSGSDNEDNNINIQSYIIIKGNPDIINDCTPELAIFTEKENIIAMAFSGNAEDWSEWKDYSESYNQFNIASGFYGTTMESGTKTVYVRFKNANGTIFPQDFQESFSCSFEYIIQELYSIKIDPAVAEIKVGEKQDFMLRGYDLNLNEVPLDGGKVEWTKSCDVGELNPTIGLQTTYISPEMPGVRNISAHYGSLRTGVKIYILQD
jgi:hypothetical protein